MSDGEKEAQREVGFDYSLGKLVLYFLKLGSIGFGGPVALTGYMQRDLVEQKAWITKEEYVEGFALAQLAPGPLAAQLAIYLGWARGRVLGATLTGIAFILPSFLMCVALAIAYIEYGSMAWIQSVFYTVGAAVIGIIIFSAFKLVKKTVGKDKVLLPIWTVSALMTAWTESESVWVFLAAGFIALIAKTSFQSRSQGPGFRAALFLPLWSVSGVSGPASGATLWSIATYFTKSGAFVFGSGLAIVPFLYGGVVQEYGWLSERQFVDAVAVAMITPGPVVITVAFIGYLVAGTAGAVIASLGAFLPCYLLTVIPAPYYSRFAKNQHIKFFVEGVTAAAIGAIAGATWVLGKRAIFDLPTLTIAIMTLVLIAKAKIPAPLIILASGILGILIKEL